MRNQLDGIAKGLPQFGWELAEVEDDPQEWWADAIWRIESVWHTANPTRYLTLLVDPQRDGPRKKGEGVWAVGTSVERPRSRSEAEGAPLLTLGRGWRERLPDFLKRLRERR